MTPKVFRQVVPSRTGLVLPTASTTPIQPSMREARLSLAFSGSVFRGKPDGHATRSFLLKEA